jgi:NAD+ kinase
MGKADAGNTFRKLALLASPTERAQEAAEALGTCAEWVPLEQAEAAVVLGGDGFML